MTTSKAGKTTVRRKAITEAKTFLNWPQPVKENADGVVAIGGDLAPEILAAAYGSGIFPWPTPTYPLLWFSPDPRAILHFDQMHIPRSLAKVRRTTEFTFTVDQAFKQVITQCSKSKRPGQAGTWITPAMVKAYIQFHKEGFAHSVECWDKKKLVGGIYGVGVKGVFAGESMFYKKPYASKLALLYLIEHLRSRGARWMDIQSPTPHMIALGSTTVPRLDFLKMLGEEQSRGLQLF